MRTLLPAGLRLLAVLVLGLLIVRPDGDAWAHAVLRSTTPADGAALEAAPSEVSIRFSEPVQPITVRVVGAAGDVADPLTATSRDGVVTLPLPAGLADGRYLLSWRVTSLDGHPVAGAVSFAVGNAGAGAAPTLDAADNVWPSAIVRFLQYATLLVAAGLALFLALRPGDARDVAPGAVRIAAAVAALTAAVGVGLEGAELLGTPVVSLFSGRPWQVGGESSMGLAAAVTIAGIVALLAGVEAGCTALGRPLLAIGAIVAVAGLALTGHAGTADPRWLTAPALAIHGLAAAFWVGGLLALVAIVARRPGPTAAAALARFSFEATIAVGALVLCGVVLVVVQVETFDGVGTPYGWRLVAKLAVVVAMLALAAANRWRLTPRLAASDAAARGLLLRSIGIETGLALVVVGLTVSLGTTPPPRAAVAAEGPAPCSMDAGTRIALSGGGLTGGLTVLPACTGSNQLYLALSDAAGHPLAAKEATIRLTQTEAGLGPLTVVLTGTGAGRWQATTDALALAGPWRAEVAVLIDDFNRTALFADLTITSAP